MKTFKAKKEIWIWIIIIIPLIFFFIIQKRLPAVIPSHWDLSGNVNGRMHPLSFILTMTGTNAGVYLLMLFLPKIDPRKNNYQLFSKTYFIVRLIIALILSLTCCISLAYAIGYHFNINKVIVLMLLLFFMILGNYMGKVRPNWFVGIRTPWTLSSEIVWKKTHQLAGKLLFFASLAGFILAIFLNHINPQFIILAVIIIGLLIPVVYSYFEYKKIDQPSENQ